MAATTDIQINADLLSFVKTPEFLYTENPNGEDYDGSSTAIVITMPMIKRYDYTPEGSSISVYQHCMVFARALFGESFNEKHPAYYNFAYATYEGDNLKMFARPVLVKQDNELVLLMGSQSKEDDREYVKVPLIKQDDKLTFGGSSINRLSLSSVDIPKLGGQPNEKIKLPILIFRANGTVYSVSVRSSQDSDFFELQDAWDDKDLDKLLELVSPLYGASANLSNMFGKVFTAKRLPESGIVIKIISAKTQQVDSKKEGGEGKKFNKVVFTVDCSELPPIEVKAYSDGQEQFVLLPNVTTISCYNNHTASVPVLQGKRPDPSNPWYLWIEKANSNPNQVPVHQVYTGFVPPKVKKIIEAAKKPGFISVTPSSSLPANEPDDELPNYDDNPL